MRSFETGMRLVLNQKKKKQQQQKTRVATFCDMHTLITGKETNKENFEKSQKLAKNVLGISSAFIHIKCALPFVFLYHTINVTIREVYNVLKSNHSLCVI